MDPLANLPSGPFGWVRQQGDALGETVRDRAFVKLRKLGIDPVKGGLLNQDGLGTIVISRNRLPTIMSAQSLTPTEYPHIALTQNNVPVILGTTLKVVELVMAQRAYGWTPEEIQINHRYLSMAQIYAALAYYWDHREGLEQDIQQREAYVEGLEKQAQASPFVLRLKNQGLLA